MEKPQLTFEAGGGQNAEAAVESELEAIFGDTGKEALLREFFRRYEVVPSDAIRRPGVFQTALYYLLGELGSKLVIDRIMNRVSGSISPRKS
jgi:hypothetical protein